MPTAPAGVRKTWYVTIPDECTTKWTPMTLVPVRLPTQACVPEPSRITFPSAVLAVRAALVGTALPDTEIEVVAPDGAAAAKPSEAVANTASAILVSGRISP